MDFQIYKAVDAKGPDFLHPIFKFLATDLVVVIVLAVALLFLIPWRTNLAGRRRAAVAATASAALALLIAQPIAQAIDRARPFVDHPQAHLLVGRSTDPSFPSDHATGAFAIAVAIFLYDRTVGWVFLALAVLISAARVYVGIHYPGDVLGGAVLGALVALVLHWGPLRGILERVADFASGLWDRVLEVIPGRRAPSSGETGET
jgi:undecaprenyl-diphosphatase